MIFEGDAPPKKGEERMEGFHKVRRGMGWTVRKGEGLEFSFFFLEEAVIFLFLFVSVVLGLFLFGSVFSSQTWSFGLGSMVSHVHVCI